MRTRILTALVAAGAVGLGACGDRFPTPLGLALSNPPGDDEVVLEISGVAGSTTPVYTWVGGEARVLTVTRVNDGMLMWRLEAADPVEGFDPPVQHGSTPSGALETQEAVLLTGEEEYRVTVTTVEGAEGSLRFSL